MSEHKNKAEVSAAAPLVKMKRTLKERSPHPCICGCGKGTKRTWFPGHDGRATGWATRVSKGLISLDGVPENERNGALVMLARWEREQRERASEEAAA